MIKVAVVNMEAQFADVEANMIYAEKMIAQASQEKAQIIVFPEFFTTGFAVSNDLITAIQKSQGIQSCLIHLSQNYGIALRGSYLHYDINKKAVYNTFGLSMSEIPKQCSRPIRSKTTIISGNRDTGLPPPNQGGCYFAEIEPRCINPRVVLPENVAANTRLSGHNIFLFFSNSNFSKQQAYC